MNVLDTYTKQREKETRHEGFQKFIRILNTILLLPFLLVLGGFDEIMTFEYPGYSWFIVFGAPPILSYFILKYIMITHEFFEWDRKERKKKKEFVEEVTFLVTFFCYLSVFLLTFSIYDISKLNLNELDKIELVFLFARLFYGVIFLFNAIFNVRLHYSYYSRYLEFHSWEIAKKPENWEWERTTQDDIKDFFG